MKNWPISAVVNFERKFVPDCAVDLGQAFVSAAIRITIVVSVMRMSNPAAMSPIIQCYV